MVNALNVVIRQYLASGPVITMTGAKHFVGIADPGWQLDYVEVGRQSGIYCDMLEDTFTKMTGLYTSL
ncbi:hypothetical protein [Photobacterium kishitanii]|uniref:hypothetical protein n=1 Tax=Photobacterium kishitanii TaxID=318456 RepID=UPI000D17D42D|nr:hypothetical protein [Photobacterium kishitanii]PSV08632.1 hypothetical protein C0W28_21190 [Photobacterium kishitanii]